MAILILIILCIVQQVEVEVKLPVGKGKPLKVVTQNFLGRFSQTSVVPKGVPIT